MDKLRTPSLTTVPFTPGPFRLSVVISIAKSLRKLSSEWMLQFSCNLDRLFQRRDCSLLIATFLKETRDPAKRCQFPISLSVTSVGSKVFFTHVNCLVELTTEREQLDNCTPSETLTA